MSARPSRPAWVYQGPEATDALALTADQLAYALTARWQLADRLARHALAALAALPLHSQHQARAEWAAIATRCTRERRRVERADHRRADLFSTRLEA